jgi:acyl-CoA synthetase (AMP-forming)/AMP-acid ligase II
VLTMPELRGIAVPVFTNGNPLPPNIRTILRDQDDFMDTGDMELLGGRYHFTGRREGIINVGGQKVRPEEVDA